MLFKKSFYQIIFLAFLAANGFSQYPGWKNYTYGKEIQAILADNNIIWIGTDNHGLVKFDGVAWTVYNVSNSSIPYNSISALEVDMYGNKWIGTSYNGLAKFNNLTWEIYK